MRPGFDSSRDSPGGFFFRFRFQQKLMKFSPKNWIRETILFTFSLRHSTIELQKDHGNRFLSKFPRWNFFSDFPKKIWFKGKFQSHEPAVAAPEPLDDSTSSPMEVVDEPHDDHDEAWCDEDAGAASGGSQATLSFGSAAALGESPAACAALSWVREVAPPRRAEGPCRQTLSRRRQVALGAAKRQMASYMAGWLTRGAEQQSQQSLPQSSETQRAAEPLLEEDDSSAVPAAACTAEPGSDGGRDSNSDSCSETDMLVEDGVDLPLQEWVGEGEQAEAQGAVEEHCDDGGSVDHYDQKVAFCPNTKNSSDIDAARRRRHGQSSFTFQIVFVRKLSLTNKMDKLSWTDHMTNVAKKRSSHPGCIKIPSFGNDGSKKAEFCSQHAQQGMVDVCSKRCCHPDCTTRPNYGEDGSKKAEFCSQHARQGMLNIRSKRCCHPNCTKGPSFGEDGSKNAEFCCQYALQGMVDVVNRKCRHPGCKKRASYGQDGSKKTELCAQHALRYGQCSKRCGHLQCTKRASYG
ncbi:unnamed protein product [Ectocarpus sp. CCAP 1310/34]|nr:unnamed protein product [Ectocarpus sp. CCAP 1310/34]